MNRLDPLIRRRSKVRATFAARAIAASMPTFETPRWIEDAKLFAAGWVGGLVVFGTLIA